MQHTLEADGLEQREGEHGYHEQILFAEIDQRRIRCEPSEEGTGEEQAEHGEQQEAAGLQHDTRAGCVLGGLMVMLAQSAGNQAIDTNAKAGRQRDHQRLDRKGQRHRRERVRVVLGYENAVHDVIQRLHQH